MVGFGGTEVAVDAPGPAIHVGQVRAAQTEEGMERNQDDEQ